MKKVNSLGKLKKIYLKIAVVKGIYGALTIYLPAYFSKKLKKAHELLKM